MLKHHIFYFQYYKAPKTYETVLDGFNIGFTMVFLLECILKLLALRPRVSDSIIQFYFVYLKQCFHLDRDISNRWIIGHTVVKPLLNSTNLSGTVKIS